MDDEKLASLKRVNACRGRLRRHAGRRGQPGLRATKRPFPVAEKAVRGHPCTGRLLLGGALPGRLLEWLKVAHGFGWGIKKDLSRW